MNCVSIRSSSSCRFWSDMMYCEPELASSMFLMFMDCCMAREVLLYMLDRGLLSRYGPCTVVGLSLKPAANDSGMPIAAERASLNSHDVNSSPIPNVDVSPPNTG